MPLTTYTAGEVLTAASLNANFTFAAANPTSKIVQVVTTALPTTFSASVAAGTQTAVTGLSVVITPTLATSKILVMATVTMATTTGANSMYFSLTRGGSQIGVGTAAGSRQAATGGAGVDTTLGRTNSGGSIQYIDSPATTSATTYAVTVGHTSGVTQTVYVNQTDSDTNANYIYRTISTITVMEVLA